MGLHPNFELDGRFSRSMCYSKNLSLRGRIWIYIYSVNLRFGSESVSGNKFALKEGALGKTFWIEAKDVNIPTVIALFKR